MMESLQNSYGEAYDGAEQQQGVLGTKTSCSREEQSLYRPWCSTHSNYWTPGWVRDAGYPLSRYREDVQDADEDRPGGKPAQRLVENPYPVPTRSELLFGSVRPDEMGGGPLLTLTESEDALLVEAGSCSNGGVRVSLHDMQLWKAFYVNGTEMVINKCGRRMFPNVALDIRGLAPHTTYSVHMRIVPADGLRYKFINDHWLPVAKADLEKSHRLYPHPDSPNSAEHWARKRVSFSKVKVTNNKDDCEQKLVLQSMCKYLAEVLIERSGDDAPSEQLVFPLPLTTFIAVTAYQNKNIVEMKIQNNPFAKAFRPMDGWDFPIEKRDLMSPDAPFSPLLGPPVLERQPLAPSSALNTCLHPKLLSYGFQSLALPGSALSENLMPYNFLQLEKNNLNVVLPPMVGRAPTERLAVMCTPLPASSSLYPGAVTPPLPPALTHLDHPQHGPAFSHPMLEPLPSAGLPCPPLCPWPPMSLFLQAHPSALPSHTQEDDDYYSNSPNKCYLSRLGKARRFAVMSRLPLAPDSRSRYSLFPHS